MEIGKEVAQKVLNNLIGQTPTRITLGHGSFITMDVGRDIAQEVKSRQGTRIRHFGEWRLWIKMCAWRIDKEGEPFLGSDDDRGSIEKKLLDLSDKKIIDIKVLNHAFDTNIIFEGDFEFHLFSFHTEGEYNEEWLMFTPEKRVFVAGPGKNWCFEDSSKPKP